MSDKDSTEDDLQLPETEGEYEIITDEGGVYKCHYHQYGGHWEMEIEGVPTEVGWLRTIQIPPLNIREWIIAWESIPSQTI